MLEEQARGKPQQPEDTWSLWGGGVWRGQGGLSNGYTLVKPNREAGAVSRFPLLSPAQGLLVAGLDSLKIQTI